MGISSSRSGYREGSEFSRTVDEFLEAYWQHDPIEATRSGIHRYDDQLPSYGPEVAADWGDTLAEFTERFEAFDAEELTDDEALDRRWALAVLERQRIDHDLRYWERAPQQYLDSLGTGLNKLVLGEFAPAEERFESLVARLEAIRGYLDTAEDNIDPEKVPPVWVESALGEADSFRQFLESRLPEAAERVPEMTKEVLAASEAAVDAVDEFADYVKSIEDDADGEYAIGRERFDRILQDYHMLEMDADDLHEFGQEWIDRYQRQMTEVAEEMGYDDWVTALESVKADHPEADDLRRAYEEETELAREHCLEHDLISFPEGESVEIEWMPAYLRDAYRIALPQVPAPFGENLDGKWYITPVDPEEPEEKQEEHLRDHSWAWIRGITQHEMYPGHHHHYAILNQVGTPLRKQFTSPIFTEGWGLYTEELFYETGLLDEPPLRLMQLRNGLWRAVRIVIDTGLHTRGMSPEEATQFLVDEARLERRWAEAETRRYTMTPTYISSYRVGLTKLREIRQAYEEKKGNEFRLKEFHDDLMQYSMLPFSIVEEELL